MAEAKPAPPAQPIDLENSTFLRNPSGAIHDVELSHPAVGLAARAQQGWNFASSEAIKAYAKLHNLEQPDAKAHTAQATRLRKEAAAEDVAAGRIPLAPEPEAPEAEPEKAAEQPKADKSVLAPGEEWDATEAARTQAKATGVDLGPVKGTGAGGTVIKADVDAAAAKAAQAKK